MSAEAPRCCWCGNLMIETEVFFGMGAISNRTLACLCGALGPTRLEDREQRYLKAVARAAFDQGYFEREWELDARARPASREKFEKWFAAEAGKVRI